MTPEPRRRFEYDDEDPFGSRPDEKPPQGWEAGFWDNVTRRIEEGKNDPGRRRFPKPARNNRGPAIMVLVMITAALLLLQSSSPSPLLPPVHGPAGEEASIHPSADTIVHVSGSRTPDVAVEWARIDGQQSGYVVLQSVAPDISYVLIDPRLFNPAVAVQ